MVSGEIVQLIVGQKVVRGEQKRTERQKGMPWDPYPCVYHNGMEVLMMERGIMKGGISAKEEALAWGSKITSSRLTRDKRDGHHQRRIYLTSREELLLCTESSKMKIRRGREGGENWSRSQSDFHFANNSA